ncbi:hypothetical protein NDU88_000299 [Pleurodeles waltl]|uniref:Uncharacterized protein n=1 Tax=Pleurodeles waltl TaxID=8319 RepID=A0AAV7V4Q2_PLEWA|nr:hypothetical protein NDU88_000299 [Pleurodeles waltl]
MDPKLETHHAHARRARRSPAFPQSPSAPELCRGAGGSGVGGASFTSELWKHVGSTSGEPAVTASAFHPPGERPIRGLRRGPLQKGNNGVRGPTPYDHRLRRLLPPRTSLHLLPTPTTLLEREKEKIALDLSLYSTANQGIQWRAGRRVHRGVADSWSWLVIGAWEPRSTKVQECTVRPGEGVGNGETVFVARAVG